MLQMNATLPDVLLQFTTLISLIFYVRITIIFINIELLKYIYMMLKIIIIIYIVSYCSIFIVFYPTLI